jgi:hypothetical protein
METNVHVFHVEWSTTTARLILGLVALIVIGASVLIYAARKKKKE